MPLPRWGVNTPTGRPHGGANRKPLAPGSQPIPAIGLSTSLAAIEAKLGGRDPLVAALSHAPYSQTLSLLLGLIGDPTRASTPLATLAAMAGVTAGEILEAYIAGDRLKAEALSVSKISEHLADVTEATMKGALVKSDDIDAQRLAFDHKKLALDLGRLLPKSAGVQVAIQNNNSVHGGVAGGSLEALQAATDAILYGDSIIPPEPVDAEILDAEATESPSEMDAAAEEACEIEEDWRGDQPLD